MTRSSKKRPSIHVLAGTNGAGKSSVAGAALRDRGEDYFNPDEAARELADANPRMPYSEANAEAWYEGKRRLENAIASRTSFTFETTLGGNTITALLLKAHEVGLAVRMWYVGLASPELHIKRVRSRVAAGGHDIPESKIRERYESSRANLVKLVPSLTELAVYDNSTLNDPKVDDAPEPFLIVHVREGKIVQACDLTAVPEWAKPIFAAVVDHYLI